MKKVILLAAAAVSLGACDMLKGSSPARKPGLWQQTLVTDASPTPIVIKACYDAASDRRSPVVPKAPTGRRADACPKFQVNKNGDGYVVDSSCSFAGATITNHGVLSGDFSSKYTMVTTIHVEGAQDPKRNGDHKTTLTAIYQGACPAEIQPGQVQCPNGDVVDMASLRRGGCGEGMGGGYGGRRDRGDSNATDSNATTTPSNAAK